MFSFAVTIFLSAFLLFQIQPLISRYILPWFGGAPAVWSSAMLFFQLLLLGGYSYAHWLSTRTKRKVFFHIVLLAGSVLMLLLSARGWGAPLLPDSSWKPPNADFPFLRIIIILLVSVGLPYFILSTTSPLLQSWFKFLFPGQIPYWLYALSNFASFLALISYPLLFERLLTLKEQSLFWSISYTVFAGGCIFLAARVLAAINQSRSFDDGGTPLELQVGETTPSSLPRKLLWVALPACSSVLLLSATNQLTQEVAVIPFLWILPLSVYLLTFTAAFSGEKWYRRSSSLAFLCIATLLVCYALDRAATIGLFSQIGIYLFYLLFATLVCHGELYRLRPDPQHLTSFYLLVSLGGALGGLFVNLAAPVLFQGYWELQVGVLLCWILVIFVLIVDRRSVFHSRWVFLVAPLLSLFIGGVSVILYEQLQKSFVGAVEVQRNFYGVFRVRLVSVGDPPADTVSLSHGITTHGFQFIESEKRKIPTSYYAKRSGIGLAITHFNDTQRQNPHTTGLRVGVIGLGAGTLGAYGKSGDYYRFYEINPDIIDLALGKNGHFTFLKDTSAAFDIVAGDARLSLEQELARGQPQNFDILAVDAFSGDSIPVHLLTREAFAVYLRHLQPQGVLAIHISNRYLDLAPLVHALGEHYALSQALIANSRDEAGAYASTWILLSKNKAFFELPEIADNQRPFPQTEKPIRVWTDDYSNLLPFLRMGNIFNFR